MVAATALRCSVAFGNGLLGSGLGISCPVMRGFVLVFLHLALLTLGATGCKPTTDADPTSSETQTPDWQAAKEKWEAVHPEEWDWEGFAAEKAAEGVVITRENMFQLANELAARHGIDVMSLDLSSPSSAHGETKSPLHETDKCTKSPDLFVPACVEHDYCTDHGWEPDCGKTQFDCDVEFLANMNWLCLKRFGWFAFLDPTPLVACIAVSLIYYEAVVHLGGCYVHIGPRMGQCGPIDNECSPNTLDCGHRLQYPDEYCGTMVCGDGACQSQYETPDSCPRDCARCGDGVCTTVANWEGCSTCEADCGNCPSGATCGDGTCDAATGEDCGTCLRDCPCWDPTFPVCLERRCVPADCMAGGFCGDGLCCLETAESEWCPQDCSRSCIANCGDNACCRAQGETDRNCPADCGCTPGCVFSCGNGCCCFGAGENHQNCPADCSGGAPTCGDGTCAPFDEDCGSCPGDCPCATGSQCSGNVCVAIPSCGNGSCDPGTGEDCESCGLDCACPEGSHCENRTCVPGEGLSCGDIGGNYCSTSGSCPAGSASLGTTYDCRPCCRTSCQSNGCPGGSCGSITDNCGKTLWCGECGASCGDGKCAPYVEDSWNCLKDCPPVCGNGTCDNGETCSACPSECGACPPVCGDGKCAPHVEDSWNCLKDCPPVCGNGTCDNGETCSACPSECFDCRPPGCGVGDLCEL
jgi:hypothetical protein